jgi:hypothetical protein
MTWIALLLAFAALGVEKREKESLKETLVDVLDADYNIRGQQALPGQPLSQKVSDRLARPRLVR